MSEYEAIFTAHLQKLNELQIEQVRVNAEIEKNSEMLKASFFLMTDEEQGRFLTAFTTVMEQAAQKEIGLTHATRNILESNPKEWFDAVKMRNRLTQTGFDFSGYTSNPLSSVHTVLKRFKRTEVKVRKGAMGLKEYRWVSQVPSLDDPNNPLFKSGMRPFVRRRNVRAAFGKGPVTSET